MKKRPNHLLIGLILFLLVIGVYFIGYFQGKTVRVTKFCEAILSISGDALDHLNWTKYDFENLNDLKRECYKKFIK